MFSHVFNHIQRSGLQVKSKEKAGSLGLCMMAQTCLNEASWTAKRKSWSLYY